MQAENMTIRRMARGDAAIIHAENLAQGWHSDLGVYAGYFEKQESGALYVFAAEWDGRFAGYTTLRPQALDGPFAGMGIPEIADFNVFVAFRGRGIGGRILDAAEAAAARLADTVSLGVGLHAGYGAAQRMYAKRGYVPNGSGVWYRDKPLAPYADCRNGDDLVLYLSKRLAS